MQSKHQPHRPITHPETFYRTMNDSITTIECYNCSNILTIDIPTKISPRIKRDYLFTKTTIGLEIFTGSTDYDKSALYKTLKCSACEISIGRVLLRPNTAMQNILFENNLIFHKDSIGIRTIPLKICLLEIFSRIADYSQTIDNYSETYEDFLDR